MSIRPNLKIGKLIGFIMTYALLKSKFLFGYHSNVIRQTKFPDSRRSINIKTQCLKLRE